MLAAETSEDLVSRTLVPGPVSKDTKCASRVLHNRCEKRGDRPEREREEVEKAATGKDSGGRRKGVGFLCVSLLCFDLASGREILC